MSEKANADIEKLTYEQARDELMQVVQQLEQGTATLEDSMKLWERGEALAAQCEKWLTGAKKRLDDALAAKKDD
ncbi:MAG: exodeoxyribonuclease VII small subunit [Micrococcales bacterium]